MNLNNTDHLTDDFLENLIKKTSSERPSDDFTQKVMSALPATERVIETVEKLPFKWWHWAMLAAVFTGVGYMIFSFDVFGRFSEIDPQPGINLVNYVKMFSSIVHLFTDGFAKIEFTTMPLLIILAGAVLFFGDKLLRKRMNIHVVMF